MDQITPCSRDGEAEIDIESGVAFREGTSRDSHGQNEKQAITLIAKVCGRSVDGSMKDEERLVCNNEVNSSGACSVSNESLTNRLLEGQECGDNSERTAMKEKRKKSSNKKAPKPPRPPRGPSLDAADQKLIREISEVAMLKRARIERIKALKKMKAAKAPSSSGNVFAMVFTILFFIVILFQGKLSSKSAKSSFQGSPVSLGGTDGGLISVQYYLNPSASDPNAPGSETQNFVQQVAGSDPPDKLRRSLD